MNPPPRFAGTNARDVVRAVFDEAGYTEAELGRNLGPGIAALMSVGAHVGRARSYGGHTAQAFLARLFLLGQAATWEEARDLLGHDRVTSFRQAGLLTGDTGCLAAVGMTPVGELLIAHDRRDAHRSGAAAFVPGPAPATRRFADLAIRRPGATVLDLGCGQGLLALLAAELGGRAVATDLNPRAVAFVAFNAALNRLDNVTCLQGDLFAPVAGQRFDLVLSNPPFVISPASAFLYRDGPGICERIAREAPACLASGGVLQMAANWPCLRGHDWKADLLAWCGDAGCDVWVLQSDRLDPVTYATIWLRQAHDVLSELGPDLDEWLAFYDRAGIEAIGAGVITMRRRGERDPGPPYWFEIRDMPPLHGPGGDTIARVLAARDVLARLDDSTLLDAFVALAPEARSVATRRPAATGWEQSTSELRLTRGLALALRLDPAGTAIAGFLDGTRPARAAVETFAAAVGVPAAAVMPGVPALLRRLIETGLAVVREGDASDPASAPGRP